jgi:hypothetical protein
MPLVFQLVAFAVIVLMSIMALYTVKDLIHDLRKGEQHETVRRSKRDRR